MKSLLKNKPLRMTLHLLTKNELVKIHCKMRNIKVTSNDFSIIEIFGLTHYEYNVTFDFFWFYIKFFLIVKEIHVS